MLKQNGSGQLIIIIILKMLVVVTMKQMLTKNYKHMLTAVNRTKAAKNVYRSLTLAISLFNFFFVFHCNSKID